jgi:EAL domain-containing protein (putative c-di-GMP-specific phosphodiesterase class I)
MDMAASRQLLVIDDEPGIAEFVCNAAAELGLVGRATTDPDEFRAALQGERPACVVLDLQMPDVDGIELLRHLSEIGSTAPVVLMSGADARVLASVERLAREYKLAVQGVLRKPFSLAELRAVLEPCAARTVAPSLGELEEAIAENQFVVEYQPIVSLAPNGLRAPVKVVEALVRWQHPRRGRLSPDRFIPVVESSGLATRLTELVLADALGLIARWDAAGRNLSASINLARTSLAELDLPDRMRDLVRANGIDPARITFEVTETTAMANTALSLDVLGRLRLKGFGLSIDDFGTGYSSLIELYRMPFSELKIDKSFVLDADQREEARVIVRSIADLAHNLGLTVCAEGVERPAHLATVAEAGCEVAQGYLLSRPVAADLVPRDIELNLPLGAARPAASRAVIGRAPG